MFDFFKDIRCKRTAVDVLIEEVKNSDRYTPAQKVVIIYNAREIVRRMSAEGKLDKLLAECTTI